MKKLFLILFLFSVCRCPAAEWLSPVWFQHIGTPMSLHPGQGEKYAADLRNMLLAGKNDEEIIRAFPDDPSPRILFIALGDGEWPERIAFDTGETFRKALKNTLVTLRRKEKKYAVSVREQQKRLEEQSPGTPVPLSPRWQRKLKNPNQWNSLRLTIVQKSRQYENFSISLSKILLTNLNGIAFPRSAGFAFPPEQITGRYLMTPEHFFDSNQIGNILSESENFQSMSTWLNLTTSAPPFPVILFDCASFFADSSRAVRIFHCHSVPENSISPERLLKLAQDCGRSMLPFLEAGGNLKSPFPEWISSAGGKEHPTALAELSIAYARLHAAGKNAEFAGAAAKINRGLLTRLRKYKTAGGSHSCIVEKELLDDPDDPQEPRRIVNTYTNAMVAMALLEYTRCTGQKEFLPAAERLIRHLINVQQNSGAFLPVFVYPGMRRAPEQYFSENGRTELDALASFAMLRFLELAGNTPGLSLKVRIHRSRNHIYRHFSRFTSLNDLPLSPWITEYLAAVNKDNLKELETLTGKIAIAANLNAETAPVLPDFFGADPDSPGLTLAAERTWLTAAAAESLYRKGKAPQAGILLSACWRQLMFQLQADMDPGTAAPLPQPFRYYGFFRDNLDAFSFNLAGQTSQIFSLLALQQVLRNLNLPELQPADKATALAWQKNWDRIRHSPVMLTPDLIVSKARDPQSVRRISGSIQGTATTTRIQPHGGRITGAGKSLSGSVLPGGPPRGRQSGKNHSRGRN